MPETINWSFSVGIAEGPRVAGSDAVDVGAYDKASVLLAAGAAGVDVQVQPATAAGKVHVLVIGASAYDAGITFSADAGATAFVLLGPLILIGSGAVELLATAPQVLRFDNTTADDVTVDILVGRDPAP
ncbi:hypothetical protein ACLQ2Q_18110 [Microbacterium sp. DT81.1]|uniref:hypothetical protein n=1 Tax=Microbacterium sp. DT81.1 TaxID=3393413 RepID=UPI003CEA01F9